MCSVGWSLEETIGRPTSFVKFGENIETTSCTRKRAKDLFFVKFTVPINISLKLARFKPSYPFRYQQMAKIIQKIAIFCLLLRETTLLEN